MKICFKFVDDEIAIEYLRWILLREKDLPIPVFKNLSVKLFDCIQQLGDEEEPKKVLSILNIDPGIGMFFYTPLIVIFGLLMLCFGFLWSPGFVILSFRKGLRKFGYRGILEYVGHEGALEVVINGSERSF
jgi:hypothetical protein